MTTPHKVKADCDPIVRQPTTCEEDMMDYDTLMKRLAELGNEAEAGGHRNAAIVLFALRGALGARQDAALAHLVRQFARQAIAEMRAPNN